MAAIPSTTSAVDLDQAFSSASALAALSQAVDRYPELRGSAIVLMHSEGQARVIREPSTPTRPVVVIQPKPVIKQAEPEQSSAWDDFWDRWGGTVLSCAGAGLSGVAIYFSAGTATVVVGAFAVNSALLCGINAGKAVNHEEWEKWERAGGGEYLTWMTIETAMELADLFNGVKGAVTFLSKVKRLGKLNKLRAALKNRNLTRRQIHNTVVQFDDTVRFKPKAPRGSSGFKSRADLRADGQIVLNNAKRLAVADGIASALTVAGLPGSASSILNRFNIVVLGRDPK